MTWKDELRRIIVRRTGRDFAPGDEIFDHAEQEDLLEKLGTVVYCQMLAALPATRHYQRDIESESGETYRAIFGPHENLCRQLIQGAGPVPCKGDGHLQRDRAPRPFCKHRLRALDLILPEDWEIDWSQYLETGWSAARQDADEVTTGRIDPEVLQRDGPGAYADEPWDRDLDGVEAAEEWRP